MAGGCCTCIFSSTPKITVKCSVLAAVLMHEQSEPHGVMMLFASTIFTSGAFLLQLEESSFDFHAHSSDMMCVFVFPACLEPWTVCMTGDHQLIGHRISERLGWKGC